MKLAKQQGETWQNQLQQASKLYSQKFEIESIPVIIEVISQICYQCFAPIERRPTMIQIHSKLAELNCKY